MGTRDGDLWMTPTWVLDLAREVMGEIDLDPASSALANTRVRAARYYTKADNDRVIPWKHPSGKPQSIWCNPPFSKVGGVSQVAPFLARMQEEWDAGRLNDGMLLTNVSTSAAWFKDMWPHLLCFFTKRLHFTHPDPQVQDSPRYDNVLAYWGYSPQTFHYVFSPYGHIVTPRVRA